MGKESSCAFWFASVVKSLRSSELEESRGRGGIICFSNSQSARRQGRSGVTFLRRRREERYDSGNGDVLARIKGW